MTHRFNTIVIIILMNVLRMQKYILNLMLKRLPKSLYVVAFFTLSLITGCVNKQSNDSVSSQIKVNTLATNETGADKAIPKYNHIFIIIAENKAYSQMIGSGTNTPNLSSLANTYGLATNFYGEVHPSEATPFPLKEY
ncbi:phosphoesterase [Calothrix sp. NIES-4071]|nr:phosphoesterase [Calothrix sp. NIES-4071]BAZ54849.1 phosphoesterase [Calothrix sp. NIES-4105]